MFTPQTKQDNTNAAMVCQRSGLDFRQAISESHQAVYSKEACAFVASLLTELGSLRKSLLYSQQQALEHPSLEFLKQTQVVRESDWKLKALPAALLDRRCELIVPASDQKLLFNALQSQAQLVMADFEDSCFPGWYQHAEGQRILKQVCSEIFSASLPAAQLACRVRSLYDNDNNIFQAGLPVSAAVIDTGLFCFHNARQLLEQGRYPHIYIAKIHSYEEAAWWSELMRLIETRLVLNPGSIKVTVIIEQLTAALQIDEIIYALQANIVAVNFGRWDFIRSYAHYHYPQQCLPGREQLNLEQGVINQLSRLLLKSCHRRGILALGGMNTLFWDRRNSESNAEKQNPAYLQWLADKHLEVTNGYDGTWVAHPGLVEAAMGIFPEPNQLDKNWEAIELNEYALDSGFSGTLSLDSLEQQSKIALLYIKALLKQKAALVIDQYVEDYSSASLSWLSIWQWIDSARVLDSGQEVSLDWVRAIVQEQCKELDMETGDKKILEQAAVILDYLLASKTAPMQTLTELISYIETC